MLNFFITLTMPYEKCMAIITSIFIIMPCIFNKTYGSYKPCHIISRNWPKCNHYMWLSIIYNYMQLHLDVFAIISYVGHICDYITTNLQLLWFSSFHMSNIYFGFHPKWTTYVTLVANVTNLVIALWIYKSVFCIF
jgi:hypothetical protein